MPTISIDITETTKQRLDLVVADYNATNGTSLTFDEWLDLHLREMAVQRELATKVEQIKRQTEDDLAAAVNAEKDRLLDAVARGGA